MLGKINCRGEALRYKWGEYVCAHVHAAMVRISGVSICVPMCMQPW